ncbi:MAG: hypothetical protein IPK66_03295 [Rhodospirillales bacterium]|nr:hypothetical protein [Rhodospirillales bacterium]
MVKEAERVVAALDALAAREARFLVRQSTARRIEYAFRRLPANHKEREMIRQLHEQSDEPASRPQVSEDRSDWIRHRQIDAMCRDRRHLLHPKEIACVNPQAACDAEHWAPALIEVDAEGRFLRLKAEAVAAFGSLGYVARTSRR